MRRSPPVRKSGQRDVRRSGLRFVRGRALEHSDRAPILPDGLVVIVKEDCETCRMVAPLLGQLGATVYTQDDPAFPAGVDADPRRRSRRSAGTTTIETVPTLIRVVDGHEVERTVGWLRSEWQRITGIATLGDDLPVMRPGCGSMSVDPDLVDLLTGPVLQRRAAFSTTRAGRSRRRDGGAVRPRRHRRTAGHATDRGTRPADVGGHDACRPTTSSPSSPPTWSR